MNNFQAADQAWPAMRLQMPVSETIAYFDHAAVAPISGPAQQAMVQWAREAAEEGSHAWPTWARLILVRTHMAVGVTHDARAGPNRY